MTDEPQITKRVDYHGFAENDRVRVVDAGDDSVRAPDPSDFNAFGHVYEVGGCGSEDCKQNCRVVEVLLQGRIHENGRIETFEEPEYDAFRVVDLEHMD